MITELFKNLYRINVSLENSALRELNSYCIKDLSGRSLVIDGGFKTAGCYDQMDRALTEIGIDRDHCDFLCTHMHSDHAALSTAFASEDGRIFLHEADLDFARNRAPGTPFFEKLKASLVQDGVPEDVVDRFDTQKDVRNADFRDARFTAFKDRAEFSYGGYTFTMIHVPGHTPGNCMIWFPKEKLMLTGDHILYDISPNISVFPGTPDSLGNYLRSLRLAGSFDPEVNYPSHREPGDYHKRITELLLHHEARLNECLDIIRMHPGLTSYEIAGRLTWNIQVKSFADFPKSQVFFAVAEALAHLDHLRAENRIRKESAGYYLK